MSKPQTVVVTDTTHYLPAELVADHGIHEVSLYVTLGDEQRRESEITDLGSFYERLRVSGEAASTSQPSIGDFLAVYEPLLEAGNEIVSIHISGVISGTVATAEQAKQQLERDGKGGERITVYDARTTCGGLGLAVTAGAERAADGGSAEETLVAAKEARESLKMWFAVDTLEYLKRGGRIGAASAWLGSALKIKPILTLEEEITPVERVRTRSRARARLVDYARSRHADGCDRWVVQHIQAAEQAAELIEECRGIFGSDPFFTSEIGPVIGAHAGPGLLGVGSVREPEAQS